MSRAAAAPCREGNGCERYHIYLLTGGTGKVKCHFKHAPACHKQGDCRGRPAELGGAGTCTFFHYIPAPPARGGGGGGGAHAHVTPKRPMPGAHAHARAAPGAPARGGAGASAPDLTVDLPEHWGDVDLAPEPAPKALDAELEAAAAPAPAIPADMAHALGKLQEVIDAAVAERVAVHVPAQPVGVVDIPDLMNFGANPALKVVLERLFAAGVAAGAAAAAGAPVPPATAAVKSATAGIVDALIDTFGDVEGYGDDEE